MSPWIAFAVAAGMCLALLAWSQWLFTSGRKLKPLNRLRECSLPMAVFGSSLSENDEHLVEALNENAERPIAVSMLPGDQAELLAKQSDVYGRLKTEKLYFFNARTHPLGDASLLVSP